MEKQHYFTAEYIQNLRVQYIKAKDIASVVKKAREKQVVIDFVDEWDKNNHLVRSYPVV